MLYTFEVSIRFYVYRVVNTETNEISAIGGKRFLILSKTFFFFTLPVGQDVDLKISGDKMCIFV